MAMSSLRNVVIGDILKEEVKTNLYPFVLLSWHSNCDRFDVLEFKYILSGEIFQFGQVT